MWRESLFLTEVASYVIVQKLSGKAILLPSVVMMYISFMKTPLENLQSIIRCPVCDKKYRKTLMLVLDEDEKRTTLHLACESCGAASMVFVSMGQFGVVSLGFLTDLKQSEARAVFLSDVVSVDHVIEAHQFLKHHTGGVEAFV